MWRCCNSHLTTWRVYRVAVSNYVKVQVRRLGGLSWRNEQCRVNQLVRKLKGQTQRTALAVLQTCLFLW